MSTTFKQLNDGWNAEPNSPNPEIEWQESDLRLKFWMNPFQFPNYQEEDIGEIVFRDCSRYRLGTLNDEGWYRGQGRFNGIRHKWGEFYEVSGDVRLDDVPSDWNIRIPDVEDRKHFLFYLRDWDFECDAREWTLTMPGIQASGGNGG